MEISEPILFKASLIFVRMSGIVFFLPIFGDSSTPVRAKALLALTLTFLFIGIVPDISHVELSVGNFFLLGAKEILIGFGLGFVARLAFEGVIMAASLVGYQMGFGMANLLVPDAGQQLNAFTALHRIILILIFLSLNLHHIFFDAIASSYTLVPLTMLKLNSDLGPFLIQLTAGVFATSIQLAAPVLVALMFTMAALGLIARTVPQINIFTLSFPVSFFIGLLVYASSFPFFPEWIQNQFQESHENILVTLGSFSPF